MKTPGVCAIPEEVTYDTENSVIRVRSWGKCAIHDWQSSKAETLRLNQDNGCTKLLVDVREQETTLGTF